ncbi:hypothetical protein MNBD_ALPHA04-1614 [hydrothermal vent metagenome]|uniref:Negative regulator of flagellin synthesis n=1 Tax=hydrothermal vent metagenome TaxID=652676 RepID=A0A3B0RHE1_9ZZZZ
MIDKLSIGQSRSVEILKTDTILPAGKSQPPIPSQQGYSVSGALSGAIEHMVQQGMPIDLQRIMAVRNAISDGQYPVDPAKIAEKILDFDRPGTSFS